MAKFERQIEVKASATDVWGVLSNIRDWPQWFPDMDEISNMTALQTGGNFDFREGDQHGTGSIVHVDEGHLLKVVTNRDGDQVTHTFELKKDTGFFGIGADNDTKFEYQREWDPPGGFIGEFVAGGNPVDTIKLNKTLDKIKDLAEGRSGR